MLYTAGDDEKADYQGTEYDYQGISTVALHYDTDTNETTYTIRLRDGVTFSDGTPMTADDLIFTYYVLCDPSYDGGYVVDEQQILGMEAYRKNNSAAPGVTVSSEEISALLNNPTEEFKKRDYRADHAPHVGGGAYLVRGELAELCGSRLW